MKILLLRESDCRVNLLMEKHRGFYKIIYEEIMIILIDEISDRRD